MIGNLFLVSAVSFVFSLFCIGLDTVENQGRAYDYRTTRWLTSALVLGFVSTIFFIAGLVSLAPIWLKGQVL